MRNIKLFAAFASIFVLFATCEKVPDFCGKNALYDPSCQFCFGSEAYNLCGGKEYNPLTQGCDRDRNTVGTRCLDESVVPTGTPCGGYTLTIAATPETGGRAVNNTPPKGPTYAVGEQVILSAIPNDQYKFAGWAGTQPTGGEVASYTMKGSTSQVTMVAMFKAVGKGKLSAETFPKDGGTITLSPNKDTYSDETVTVTAASKSGYTFIGWSGDDTSKNATITVFMDESKTLVAMFTPAAHTLSVSANPSDAGAVFVNGTALSGATSQNSGARISVWAVAERGYTFKNWSGTAKFDNINNPNTTIALESNATITANFQPGNGGTTVTPPSMICTLTVVETPPDGGNVSLNPAGGIYNMGIQVTATAKLAGEYRFAGWSDGSKNISNDTVVTISMDKSKTLTANFQLKPKAGQFIITLNANGGTLSGSSTVTTDTNGKLSSMPAGPARTGYNFNGWYIAADNGTKITTDYTFKSDTTIYAQWAKDEPIVATYTLTVTKSHVGGGTTTPASSQSNIASGTTVNISTTVNTGYTFNNWTITSGTGSTIANASSASTTVTVNGDVTVTANFTQNTTGASTDSTFVDVRDSKLYKKVKMPDGKTWMAENLNYKNGTSSDSGWCYNNSVDSCAKYGRLYTWEAAKTACPSGWHLPTRADWDQLAESVGGTKSSNYESWHDWYDAGKKLKSTTGWYNNGNGTDEYGFSALPGGRRSSDGYFYSAGYYGYWWTATEDDASYACYRDMHYGHDNVGEGNYYKGRGYSVRCVKDERQ